MNLNHVFPLRDGYKEPGIKAWQNVEAGKYQPNGNHGYALQSDALLIDADPRNFPAGRNVLEELWNAHLTKTLTRVVKTPGGGYHIYVEKPADVEIAKNQPDYPGIDFLSKGNYVVAPGSETVADPSRKQCAGVYTLYSDAPVAKAPVSLLDALKRKAARLESGSTESLLNEPQFIQECKVHPPAIEGEHGNDYTYKFACRGKDLGLPVESVYAAMRDEFSPRCVPPWSDHDLYQIVESAFRNGRNTPGCASPEAKFDVPDKPTGQVLSIKEFQDELSLKLLPDGLKLHHKTQLPLNTLANLAWVLKHNPAWTGRIKFNEFSQNIEFTERPAWRPNQTNIGLEVDKTDISALQTWLSTNYDWEITKDKLSTALEIAATRYHPVRSYLDSLVWDGISRLDKLLADTTGAEDNEVHSHFSKCTLLGAVQRIYEPGCKLDYVLVLEGKQGTGKSQWIQVLGGEWYSASELTRGDKDTYQNLRGRWFVELPEINATFSKADFNWLKGVISNPIDVYRGSYGISAKPVPRESIFIGSINAGTESAYLKDEENRRYWPVKTGRIDLVKLRRFRHQYFAEAVHRYKAGENVWDKQDQIDQVKVQKQIREQQEQRREKSHWMPLIQDWLDKQTNKREIRPVDLYAAMNIVGHQLTRTAHDQIRSAMRDIGYQHRACIGGGIWEKQVEWEDLI